MDSAPVTTSEEYGDDGTPKTAWWTRHADVLILAALGAFAVTQPLLSDFRQGAGYFVARRAGPVEIVLLVFLLTAAPGVLAGLILWAVGKISARARAFGMAALLGLFLALAAYLALLRLGWIPTVVVALVSVSIGSLGALRFGKGKWLRSFFILLIPAPLIFALFFLLTPPVIGLVFPSEASTADSPIESSGPVVFLLFDEFPVSSLLNAQGGIDGSRYPGFARLASMSSWYRYTATAHDNTLYAVPALLTGEVPDSSRLPTAANYPGNLFTLLGGSHELNVAEPFTHLCPPELCSEVDPTSFSDRVTSLVGDSILLYWMSLEPGGERSAAIADPFNEFTPGAAARAAQGEFAADHLERFAQFTDGIPVGRPSLNFFHVFLPHAPFRYYPSGSQYNDGDELDGLESEVWVEPSLARQGYQRHLLQAGVVDGMIDDLLDMLENRGLLEEALIVVTADHGISFKPGVERRPLTEANRAEVGLVPLFIKAPYQNGGTVESVPARTIDVLPTIASHLDIEIPWEYDGESLVGAQRVPPRLVIQASSGDSVLVEDVQGDLRDATSYLQSVFGTTTGSLDMYSFGRYDSILGPLDDVADVEPSGFTADVEETWRLTHVATYTGFVPGFLHGAVSGDIPDEMSIAVALNGEVVTVVDVFDTGAESLFSAIVPERAFVAGFNELTLLGVFGPTDDPQVVEIRVEEHIGFDMERASTGRVTRLLDSEGGFWPVVEGSTIVGAVDQVDWEPSDYQDTDSMDLHVSGWAVDESGPSPADRIVFFVNDVFAGSAPVDVERQDIEDVYDRSETLTSGFAGLLPQFLPNENLTLRVFALTGSQAEEIMVSNDALDFKDDG